MELYQQVFENNKKWVSEQTEHDPTYFTEMAKSQSPDFLYIGCSDSRVQPENMMGIRPGQVFIHRNIANLVPNNDINSLSVLQYAVEQLRVKHIIVCGHYGCGGVKAAVEHNDYGYMNTWLRNIQDIYRMHKAELEAIEDKEARHRLLVEITVREQCLNIMKLSFVQQKYFFDKTIQIHGWVYDLADGSLADMKIDVDQMGRDLAIYRINSETKK
ncbi:MAG: carbonic anhydrase [Bacteroidetes bacterium]|nr:carbonic anhydrase [Fibrella sp.]